MIFLVVIDISEKELNAMIEENYNAEELYKQLMLAEEQNRNKDAEIKSILRDKDEITVKLNKTK